MVIPHRSDELIAYLLKTYPRPLWNPKGDRETFDAESAVRQFIERLDESYKATLENPSG